MPFIKRKDVVEGLPLLKQEPMQVDELGGEVIVCGLMLADRLNITLNQDTPEKVISTVLAGCVLDGDRQPLFTAQEWERFGSKHDEAVLRIWEKALEISSFRKKTDDTTSETSETPEPEGEVAKNA